MSSHRLILLMGWVTLLGFSTVGLLVLQWVSGNWQELFRHGWPLYQQLVLGAVVGLVSGYGLRLLLNIRPLKDISLKYSHMLSGLTLSRAECVFLSVCAGVGEEILFRGCIQEYAGIWWTAIGFVALHGYLNPTDWKVSIYGFSLSILFVGVGYLKEYTGIYTCIVIHIVIDILLFDHLLLSMKNKN